LHHSEYGVRIQNMKSIATQGLNIIFLGAGAMGSLFGGYLSQRNSVYLLDTSEHVVGQINSNGLYITEPDGRTERYAVSAHTSVNSLEDLTVDLVIVFVKGMYSRAALQSISPIISKDTYILSLQNGIGHERVIGEFVAPEQILIGTTQHNCASVGPGSVKHGGSGLTRIGRVSGEVSELMPLAKNFCACGLATELADSYKTQVWEKLFTNVSASVLTGVLHVPLGFVASNETAWQMCRELVREAVAVAEADGVVFDVETEIEKVRGVCENSPHGLTSIYSDLANGRKSEVDTISGEVVRLAQQYGISVPYHEILVKIIRVLEGKKIKS
jgi:2-dehydropantoate 2-reductase